MSGRITLRRVIAAAIVAGLLSAMSLAIVGASGHGDHKRSDLIRAFLGTARFNSLSQAIKAGYALPPEGPLSECIASFDGTGAMGFHYINGALLDDKVNPGKPEALVYAADRQGRLRLVAVEYVVFKDAWQGNHPPMLFGEMFMEIPEPNRYELPAFYALHAWIWKWNPSGLFASFNPRVSCD